MRGRTGVSAGVVHDFGYLACCTGCCDDAEDFLLGYLAVNRKNLFAPLACALLVFSMLGCGVTDHLQSITLSNSNTSRPRQRFRLVIPTGRCKCMYGNLQQREAVLLYGNHLAFQIVSTPDGSPGFGFGNPNATPPQTVQLSSDGLLTPVDPAACSFVNVALPTATSPAFESVTWYTVTSTYLGFTTPPGSVYLATAGGVVSTSNPSGECYYPAVTP